MSERLTTTYRGHELIYYDNNDVWGPCAHDSLIATGTLPEVKASIDKWEVAKQTQEGFKVWHINHQNPKYWSKRDAVFRQVGSGYGATRMVVTRNSPSNPDSFYPMPIGDSAPDTPEVAEAIERARAAHSEAVEAGKRWNDAKRAIPILTECQWAKLTEMDAKT